MKRGKRESGMRQTYREIYKQTDRQTDLLWAWALPWVCLAHDADRSSCWAWCIRLRRWWRTDSADPQGLDSPDPMMDSTRKQYILSLYSHPFISISLHLYGSAYKLSDIFISIWFHPRKTIPRFQEHLERFSPFERGLACTAIIIGWITTFKQPRRLSGILHPCLNRGTWWRIGWVDCFQPEGRGFDSHSSRYVGTLGKSLTHSCLWRFGVKLRHSIRAVSEALLSRSGLEEAL